MTQHTRLVEFIFPEQANHYGTLFGGNALNLLSRKPVRFTHEKEFA